ncbi:aspartate--tRNA(Asn) ligase [Serpentinicella alkaliphila]|uniref:Aspartate--tRNA ligase n=1 Tax=Serpentinicella alkaliphila TaxID=1734049 RepID=A0A4R2TXI0_9FIRM|nr:aspartate--tRNA(Asn) ligase [Serpentinicella alkaliphila]QUH25344.1 aspartate--tRNA(Asn) ligase [Serpentinicella alkaliphila]TCQ02369.1 aspartyl-tRNA synthetase [Serpentinicella alkaliphila]
MERVFIKEILQSEPGKSVKLKGWVYKIHNLGKISFIILRDKTGLIQLVVEASDREGLKLEMPIEVIGETVVNPKAINGVEIAVQEIVKIADIHYDVLPFAINMGEIEANLENQLNFRSISLRNPRVRAPFKIQEEIVEAFRTFLKNECFTEIHTPKIVASGTEGGSEMFSINYFNRRVFLAQSPQFYKQMMVGAGFERVFEVGHAYRAELHNTWRHLNEYVSLDIEMGFIESEEEIMDLEERFLIYLFDHLNETCQKELELFKVELPKINKIPRIPLKEIQRILLDDFNKKSPEGNIDAEGEVIISKYIKEKYNSEFLFITKYPVAKRPVYTMPDAADKTLTRSFDLIYKGLEITTGGQRIHDYEMLKQNMIDFKLNPEDFSFYLDSFKYGMPPHGGLAIGLERLTMKLLDLENIRQATLLPRDMKRVTP